MLLLLFISLPITSHAQQHNLDDKLAFDGAIRSQQKIIIGNNNETIDNSKFISLEEYLENRNETSFQSQNLQKDYDALLDKQNQGFTRKLPENWNKQNSALEGDDGTQILAASSIPQSLNKINASDILIYLDGTNPALNVSEASGDLYIVFNTVDATYSAYKMFYVYKSIDNGQTWSYLTGAFNTGTDLLYPIIVSLKDYTIASYVQDGKIGLFQYKLSDKTAVFKTITIPNQNNSAVNDSVLWGSIISDKFYYDESATWTYMNYLAVDKLTNKNNIYYIMSKDQGATWLDPVAIVSQEEVGMRWAISTGYTTPEPYTSVDFLWFTWLDTDNNVNATKVNVYTATTAGSSPATTYNIVPKTTDHKAWHGTIATYFDNLFVTGPIDWETDSKTSSNSNPDLYMTFSKDGGEKWGTDDYSWYYWRDLNDKPDYRPVATYGENGVLGFAWTYDGDLNFRTNSTGDFLQGWNPATGSDVNSNGPIYIAPTILDSTFHYAYSAYDDNTGVYYNNKDMTEALVANLFGIVTSALDGSAIAGATVNIAGLTATTDADGKFEIKGIKPGYVVADFSANTHLGSKPLTVKFNNLTADGSQPINIEAADFISYEGMVKLEAGKDHTLEYSLTPQLGQGEMRVVLNWGASPEDLDAHLFTPEIDGWEYHVYWLSTGDLTEAPFAALDHDDYNSYGPETITISQLFTGTYTFYVSNYLGYDGTGTAFADAEASVSVYNDQGNIATIRLPSSATGTEDHWEVFTIDGSNGEITLVNALTDTRPDITSGRIETRAQKNNISQKPMSNMRGKTINSGTMFYKWDFGDGNTSTDESPTHIYQNSGNYTVKLESSDGANYSFMSYPDLITVVDNMPPVVTTLAPDTVAVGLREMVSIDLDTLFSDPDNDPLSYSVSTSNVFVAQPMLTGSIQEPNSSLSFDGTDDYVDLGVISSTNFTNADFSIQTWVKTTSSKAQSILVKGDGDGAWEAGEKALYMEAAGYPWFVGYDNEYIPGTGLTINDGSWHHIVVTWDYSDGETGTAAIYVDGVKATVETSYMAKTVDNSTDKLYLGKAEAVEAQNYFDGSLDEVAVWNSALSLSEITAIYNSGSGLTASWNSGDYQSSSNLQTYWRFNEETGTSVADASSNSNAGTINGATWSTDSPIDINTPNHILEITGIWPNEADLVIEADDGRVDGKVSLTTKVIVAGGLLGLDQNNIGLPESFELWEAFPNPFNPTTTLRFDLPEVSDITLTIYNMLGQKVKTFNMQSTPAGYHSVTWNATNDLGAQVGAGVYLYQLQTKDFVKTRKMVLLK